MDRHIAKVWALEFPSPTIKLVALCVARLSVRSGLCFARQKTIAADTGLHVKTVQKALADLEEKGWIKRQGFLKDDGQRGSDRIWLTLPEVVLEADEPDGLNPFGDGGYFEKGSPASNQGSPGLPTPESSTGTVPADDSSKSQGVLGESEGEDARSRELSSSDLDLAVEAIWTRVGDNGRKRSSKVKVKTALEAALSRRPKGQPAMERLELILRGVQAYMTDPDTLKEKGKFEHGAHRTLQGDVWATYLAEGRAEPVPSAVEAREPANPDIGTNDRPGPVLQTLWAERARDGLGWDVSTQGPRPGAPGCRLDPDVQRAHGFIPYEEAAANLEANGRRLQADLDRALIEHVPASLVEGAFAEDDDAGAF